MLNCFRSIGLVVLLTLGTAWAGEESELVQIEVYPPEAPIFVRNWGQVPAWYQKKARLPAEATFGMLGCPNTDCTTAPRPTYRFVKLADITAFGRERNVTYTNLNHDPRANAIVMKDRQGQSYRYDWPRDGIEVVWGNGERLRIGYTEARREGYSFQDNFKSEGDAFRLRSIPVEMVDVESGALTPREIEFRTIQSVRWVSPEMAKVALAEYREKLANEQMAEAKRVAEQQRLEAKRQAEQQAIQEAMRLAEADRLKAAELRAKAFRKVVKVGDVSHCGLVIEVKRPIVLVQALVGPVWLKVDQLYRQEDKQCVFVNGAYSG